MEVNEPQWGTIQIKGNEGALIRYIIQINGNEGMFYVFFKEKWDQSHQKHFEGALIRDIIQIMEVKGPQSGT